MKELFEHILGILIIQLLLYVHCALGFPEVLGHMLHGHEAKARAVARAARAKARPAPWALSGKKLSPGG